MPCSLHLLAPAARTARARREVGGDEDSDEELEEGMTMSEQPALAF